MKIEFDHFSEMRDSDWANRGVRFVRNGGDGQASAFDAWDGYFHPIMEALFELCFKRKSISYLPLLREWNECTGYEENRHAPVRELAETIDALRKINPPDLTEYPSAPGEVAQVLRDLIWFLNSAVVSGQTVTISNEI